MTKPLIDHTDSRRERAIGAMDTGWCPWPYLGAVAPGDTGLDLKAECRCGKRVRVTARGLLSHHKMLRRVSVAEIRAERAPWSADLRARAEALLGECERTEIVDLPAWMDAACEVLRDLIATLPPDPACRWCAAGYPFRPYDDSKSVHLSHDKTHAIGECEALPTDPAPTTREPCGAWREFHPGAFVLDGCALPRFTVCKRAYSLRWCWYSAGEEPTEADDCRSAMLAAEDAADALLLAGRRALGRIR